MYDSAMESPQVHISSMVVHARPQSLTVIKDRIERMPGVEVHAESACGKLVVVLESETQTHITDTIEQINQFTDVLSTALVYHQVDYLHDEEKSPT